MLQHGLDKKYNGKMCECGTWAVYHGCTDRDGIRNGPCYSQQDPDEPDHRPDAVPPAVGKIPCPCKEFKCKS